MFDTSTNNYSIIYPLERNLNSKKRQHALLEQRCLSLFQYFTLFILYFFPDVIAIFFASVAAAAANISTGHFSHTFFFRFLRKCILVTGRVCRRECVCVCCLFTLSFEIWHTRQILFFMLRTTTLLKSRPIERPQRYRRVKCMYPIQCTCTLHSEE